MAKEAIDWSGHLEVARQTVIAGETTSAFVTRSSDELQHLYISDATIKAINTVGCSVQGIRYFKGLFADDASQTERLGSTFVSLVAFGQVDFATKSYTHLLACNNVETVHTDLLGRLNQAIRVERDYRGYDRIEQLEGAAKALGKSVVKRAVSSYLTIVSAR